MSNVPNSKLPGTLNNDKPIRKSTSVSNDQCSLCIECNSECEECTTCTNPYRICLDCTSPCDSVTVSELDTLIDSNESNHLSILHLNVRSLLKNILALEAFILDRLKTNPQIICVTETKLNESSILSNVGFKRSSSLLILLFV